VSGPGEVSADRRLEHQATGDRTEDPRASEYPGAGPRASQDPGAGPRARQDPGAGHRDENPVVNLEADIAARTDSYFNRTKRIVARFGDKTVTYAVFLRRPVICAPRLMLDWLAMAAELRHTRIDVDLIYREGDWVGAGEPIVYLTGSMMHLSDLETILLQKIGPASVAAHNAYQMALSLPNVAFLAMEARHCAGAEMQDMMSYAASVGSTAARLEGAKGFIGGAADGTAHWFGAVHGYGTMPHSLIGYAGSTVRAAEMFRETFPDEPMTVLVDYFAREISDALAVCARFPELAEAGMLSFRLDTHGGRFLEGLDPAESYAVVERYAPGAIRRYRSDSELRSLVGTGVSAAAIWRTREALDAAGYTKVRIVVSSGFGVEKCRVMADAKAPIDVVGTGSFIPDQWHETYATADIVEYEGVPMVKIGREFLLRKNGARKRSGGG
jgi:nicotinate phosphoribosyltransferase